MENTSVNEIVAYNKVSFSKESFKYFIGQKYVKEIDLYAHFFQKWVHIGETLMKLNICLFW